MYYIYHEAFEHEFIIELNSKTEGEAIAEACVWLDNADTEATDSVFVMESQATDIDDVNPCVDRAVSRLILRED